jgi:GNAT superfamily N-acetyltransferase
MTTNCSELVPRDATAEDCDHLAQLWFHGWQSAHGEILPRELAIHRTLASFRERLERDLHRTRIVGPTGKPIAFSITRGDELYQLYVAGEAHGTGIAAILIADAERILASGGTCVAWLHCAIGNNRAARFYERSRWVRSGIETASLETETGPFSLDVWRYQKAVGH